MNILKAMFDYYGRLVRRFNADVIMVKYQFPFICIIEPEYDIVEYIAAFSLLWLVHTMTE